MHENLHVRRGKRQRLLQDGAEGLVRHCKDYTTAA